MRPDPGNVMRGVVQAITRELTPELSTPFAKTVAGLSNSLLSILSVESERLIDRLLVETRITTDILHDSCAILEDPFFCMRVLAAAARTTPPNYRLSTVQALNDDARRMLIEIHTVIEGMPGKAAAMINERIWAELRESTIRRQMEPSP